MRILFAAIVVAVLPAAAAAQTADTAADKEAVLATVNKFLDTMAAKDAAGARTALLPEGRLFIVEGAGHIAMLERPERLNPELRSFARQALGLDAARPRRRRKGAA